MRVCEPEECTGCGACVAACPVGCVYLLEDDLGVTRASVDSSCCSCCGACHAACPNTSEACEFRTPTACYAAYLDDVDERLACASGGVGTAIAKRIVSVGGVVFGTVWGVGLKAVVQGVSDSSGLAALKGSKYVQSAFNSNEYRAMRGLLDEGVPVAFIGTPCQVAGLYGYLGGRRDGLLTVELVCHGVCPPSYLSEELRIIGACNVTDVRFRGNDKRYNYAFSLWRGSKCVFRQRENPYLVAFLGGYSLRDNCFSCRYARPDRVADLTIGDFIGLGKRTSFFGDTNNASVVLANTSEGLRFFEALASSDAALHIEQRDYSERLEYGPSLLHPFNRPIETDVFQGFVRMGGYDAARRELLVPACRRKWVLRWLSYTWRVPRKVLRTLVSLFSRTVRAK